MKLGFIGLGRMGANMVQNLLDHQQKVVGYNLHPEPTKKLARKGMISTYSLPDLVQKLPSPRVIWLMIPAGKAVDDTLLKLLPLLQKGDIIIDGGNSWFKDSQRRYHLLKKKGIHFLDCGTSGGIEGARRGACMMVGGDKETFRKVEILFSGMCVKNGYSYMGKSGAGHFVKMVHNGIEYGMMGAINEGFSAIEKYQKKFGTDLQEVARVYAHGSIIESRLMNWLWSAFHRKDYLKAISCTVPPGETEEEMKELEKMAMMNILREARLMRVHSRKHLTCGKLIAAMRNEFGGHIVKKIGKR